VPLRATAFTRATRRPLDLKLQRASFANVIVPSFWNSLSMDGDGSRTAGLRFSTMHQAAVCERHQPVQRSMRPFPLCGFRSASPLSRCKLNLIVIACNQKDWTSQISNPYARLEAWIWSASSSMRSASGGGKMLTIMMRFLVRQARRACRGWCCEICPMSWKSSRVSPSSSASVDRLC
jgi:hypothetical protein